MTREIVIKSREPARKEEHTHKKHIWLKISVSISLENLDQSATGTKCNRS